MDFEGRARIHSHLDIAPLIDIVFLLLVFFMLTSTFMVPEAIELELPDSKTASATDATPVVVLVDKAGQLALNGENIKLEKLKQKLKPLLVAGDETAIILKSDARTEVQVLIIVMDEIREAGGTNISLATLQK